MTQSEIVYNFISSKEPRGASATEIREGCKDLTQKCSHILQRLCKSRKVYGEIVEGERFKRYHIKSEKSKNYRAVSEEARIIQALQTIGAAPLDVIADKAILTKEQAEDVLKILIEADQVDFQVKRYCNGYIRREYFLCL